jgi:hypothetical protein
MGLLKKAASGVLAIVPCSRIPHTLRALNKGGPLRDTLNHARPCWTAFLNRPAAFDGVTSSWANLHVNIFIIQHSLYCPNRVIVTRGSPTNFPFTSENLKNI